MLQYLIKVCKNPVTNVFTYILEKLLSYSPPEFSGCARRWPERRYLSLCPARTLRWLPCRLVPRVSIPHTNGISVFMF